MGLRNNRPLDPRGDLRRMAEQRFREDKAFDRYMRNLDQKHKYQNRDLDIQPERLLTFQITEPIKREEKKEKKEEESCCYVISATLKSKGVALEGSEEISLMRRLKLEFLAKSFSGLKDIVRYNRYAPIIVAAIDVRKDRQEIYDSVYNGPLNEITSLLRQDDFERAHEVYRNMMINLAEKVGIEGSK